MASATAAAAGSLDTLLARVHKYAGERQHAEAARALLLAHGQAAERGAGGAAPPQPPLHMAQLVRLPRGMYTWGGVGTGPTPQRGLWQVAPAPARPPTPS
jgi:predicted ATPase